MEDETEIRQETRRISRSRGPDTLRLEEKFDPNDCRRKDRVPRNSVCFNSRRRSTTLEPII